MAKRKPFTPDPATVRWAIRRVQTVRRRWALAHSDVLGSVVADLQQTSRQIAMRKAQAKKAGK